MTIPLDGGELETKIIRAEIVPGEVEGYHLVQMDTSRGRILCHYYKAEGTGKGVVFVGGVGGGFDTPAQGLYPRLARELREQGISSLRVRYRYPTDLAEATLDTVIGIQFLKSQGVRSIGVVGHSLGGAVVVRAAAYDPSVRTIVALSTQRYGTESVSTLTEGTSILLIHGTDDPVLPSTSSVRTHGLAREPKRLVLLKGAGHTLDEAADEVYEVVKRWIIETLR